MFAIRRVRDHLDRHYAEPIALADLTKLSGISRFHLVRTFRAAYGDTPINYLSRRRIERAQDLLRYGNLTVTEVCVAFPALSAIEAGYDVFVVTDASGTFTDITREASWNRMATAGAQLMSWFGVACELHRDWRNDVEGLGTLFANHISDYRNLMTAYSTVKGRK